MQELVEQLELELQLSATQTPLVPRLQVWDEPQEVSSLVQLEASHTAGVAVQELLEHWVRLVQPQCPLEQTPLAQSFFLLQESTVQVPACAPEQDWESPQPEFCRQVEAVQVPAASVQESLPH